MLDRLPSSRPTPNWEDRLQVRWMGARELSSQMALRRPVPLSYISSSRPQRTSPVPLRRSPGWTGQAVRRSSSPTASFAASARFAGCSDVPTSRHPEGGSALTPHSWTAPSTCSSLRAIKARVVQPSSLKLMQPLETDISGETFENITGWRGKLGHRGLKRLLASACATAGPRRPMNIGVPRAGEGLRNAR